MIGDRQIPVEPLWTLFRCPTCRARLAVMRAVPDGRDLWAVWDARALAAAVRAEGWLKPMMVAGVTPFCPNPVCVGEMRPLEFVAAVAALSECGDWIAIPIRFEALAHARMQ